MRTAPGRSIGASSAMAPVPGQVVETVVSPFHCLYQDALWLHTQSQLRLDGSESEASRLARAALLAYLAAAEALAHQAAEELGRPELGRSCCDAERPLPLGEVWRLLPALAEGGECCAFDPSAPPWPQFEELLALRASWAYPGPAGERRAYYRASEAGGGFEPMARQEAMSRVGTEAGQQYLPRTGLPRDPYALRPAHLDTARAVLDAAITGLDRRLGGALTCDGRHRREPIRVVPGV